MDGSRTGEKPGEGVERGVKGRMGVSLCTPWGKKSWKFPGGDGLRTLRESSKLTNTLWGGIYLLIRSFNRGKSPSSLVAMRTQLPRNPQESEIGLPLGVTLDQADRNHQETSSDV